MTASSHLYIEYGVKFASGDVEATPNVESALRIVRAPAVVGAVVVCRAVTAGEWATSACTP